MHMINSYVHNNHEEGYNQVGLKSQSIMQEGAQSSEGGVNSIEQMVTVKENPSLKLPELAEIYYLRELIKSNCINRLKDRPTPCTFDLDHLPIILLYGPPGSGKSVIARSIAEEFSQKYNLTVQYVPINAIRYRPFLKRLYCIRQIFEHAMENEPSLVIWDEFDELAIPPEFSGRKYDAEICNLLKQEFYKVVESGKSVQHLVICNNPWQIFPSLLRKLHFRNIIQMPILDHAIRKQYFKFFTENDELANDVDYDKLSELTDGMTIAEIHHICEVAANDVFHASTVGPNRKFETSDFVRHIEANPPWQLKAWLAQADAAFKGKYACHKSYFTDLINASI